MNNKISNEIIEIVNKWSKVGVVYPVGWSDHKYIASEEISYKTYLSGLESNPHRVIILYINNKKVTLTFRKDGIYVETKVTEPVSLKAILEAIKLIYTEAISIDSVVEGRAMARKRIAEIKSKIKSEMNEIKDLESELLEAI